MVMSYCTCVSMGFGSDEIFSCYRRLVEQMACGIRTWGIAEVYGAFRNKLHAGTWANRSDNYKRRFGKCDMVKDG